MDYEKVKEFLKDQRTRDPRPMRAFTNSMISAAQTLGDVEDSNLSTESQNLLMHLLITRLATLIECYFRDSLDAIYRLCKPSAFLPTMNNIVKLKYSASEIIGLEEQGLNFLETIPRQLSFQSLTQIFSVFDNYFDRGLRYEIQLNHYRIKR